MIVNNVFSETGSFSGLNHPRLYYIIQDTYRTLGKMGLAIGSSTKTELSCRLPANYELGACPVAENASNDVVNISTGIEMNKKEIYRIVDFLVKHAKISDNTGGFNV